MTYTDHDLAALAVQTINAAHTETDLRAAHHALHVQTLTRCQTGADLAHVLSGLTDAAGRILVAARATDIRLATTDDDPDSAARRVALMIQAAAHQNSDEHTRLCTLTLAHVHALLTEDPADAATYATDLVGYALSQLLLIANRADAHAETLDGLIYAMWLPANREPADQHTTPPTSDPA